jgi:hypothetical protein
MSVNVYDDEDKPRTKSFSFDPMKVDALKQWENHFSNLMYLEFFVLNPLSTFKEKRDAEKQIEIAKKKLVYWKRWCVAQSRDHLIEQSTVRIKKQWI